MKIKENRAELMTKIETKESQLMAQLISNSEDVYKVATLVTLKTPNATKQFEAIKKAQDPETDLVSEFEKVGLPIPTEYLGDALRSPIVIANELNKLHYKYNIIDLFSNSVDRIADLGEDKLKGFVSLFKDKFFNVISKTKTEGNTVGDILEEIEKEQQKQVLKMQEGKQYLGTPIGLSTLDRVLDGIVDERMYVVGGASSAGKTYFACHIANEFLLQGKRVVYYSLEMSKRDILERILAMRLGTAPFEMTKRLLDNDFYNEQKKEKEKIAKQDITIYDNLYKLEDISLSIAEECFKKNTDIVIVDYLQNIFHEAKSEYERMSESSRTLFTLAVEHKIPIVVLSQLNNERVNADGETLGFKGSGGIEASASVGVLILNKHKKKEVIERSRRKLPMELKLVVAKNRHGMRGFSDIEFNYTKSEFKEVNNLFDNNDQKADKTIKVDKLPI